MLPMREELRTILISASWYCNRVYSFISYEVLFMCHYGTGPVGVAEVRGSSAQRVQAPYRSTIILA
jgi:hypothetical protein